MTADASSRVATSANSHNGAKADDSKTNGHMLNGWHTRPAKSAVPEPSVNWQDTALRKRTDREKLLAPWTDARVPQTSALASAVHHRARILTPKQFEITSLPAYLLAERIAAREYTSVEVITAYIQTAVIAQDTTNCLTEIMFEHGLDRARELDDYIERTGRTVGPLHGVPVSIKDHIDVAGTDAASGFVGWCYKRIAAKDAVIVRCVRKAGGVIYCKTSNPQSLLVSIGFVLSSRPS